MRAVQLHRFADLFQDELPVSFQVVAGQALCAAGNQNGVKKFHADALCEFVEHHVKTMVETPDDRRIGFIPFPWGVEMEYLTNKAPRVGTLYSRMLFSRSVKIGHDRGCRIGLFHAATAGRTRKSPPKKSQNRWNNSFPPYTSF